MKKFIYCALVALVAISCEEIEDPWGNTIDIPQTLSAHTPEFESQGSGSKSRVLTEDLPESWDESEMPYTRTHAVFEGSSEGHPYDRYVQYWSSGDAISVFFTTANLRYTLAGYEDENDDGTNEEDYGLFELDGDVVEGSELSTEYYYSVYPYKENTSINYTTGHVAYNFPQTQHYSGDTYAKDENGMIARELKTAYDGKLFFQNFCSYLQLRLKDDSQNSAESATDDSNEPKIVKQITLEANDPNIKIAGEAIIKFVEDVPVVEMRMNSTNKITLNCGSGVTLSQDPTNFWFVLPGDITFAGGFKVTVTFSDNTYFEKSTQKPITIERSHVKPMAPFDTNGGNDDDIIVTGPIRYKYHDTTITEPYPLKETFYGVDGQPLKILDQVCDENGVWTVYLSGVLKSVGANSFEEYDPDIEYIIIDNNCDNEQNVPLTISDYAFYNCTAEEIKIYSDVDYIHDTAFGYAYTESLYIDGNVTELKTNAGSGAYLEEIVVTGSITTIEDQAFSGCNRLESVSFSSVGTIGYRAFYQCSSLSEIDLSTVETIEQGAFRDCTSLKEVTLNSVTTIGDNAFMGCSSLTYVEISSSCKMIGEGAFCNARNLQTVKCYAKLPPFIKINEGTGNKSYVFDRAHRNLVIYIPDGSMDEYTDPNYFVTHDSGYEPPVMHTVNWWYQEYLGKLKVMVTN